MFNLFKPKPLTPSQMGRMGAAARKAKADEEYVTFHNEMARNAGTKIKWAK